MRTFIASFWNDQSGVTAIEYGAIAVFISLALLIAMQLVSPKVQDLYAAIGWPK